MLRTEEIVYVRASVHSKCNLNCVYCAKAEGMENRTPTSLKGRRLSVPDYCRNLTHLARCGFRGVSFTGGEPTLNPDLPVIAEYAATIFEKVELTSNGFRVLQQLPKLVDSLSLLKISLDAVTSSTVAITTRGTSRTADVAKEAIRAACAAGLPVGINFVAMRSNLSELANIISFCSEINKQGYTGECHVSILDYYYNEETRSHWEQEYLGI